MDHISDEELVARCARGDRSAMDVLVSRYHAKLLDFAFRHLGNREAAADAAQAALVRVFENASSYRVRASFKTWLYTITLNLIRDEYRRRGARKELLASDMEGPGAFVDALDQMADAGIDSTSSPLDRVMSLEIWDSVDSLPERQKTVVLLRFRQQLSYDEIGAVMGSSAGTVKSLVHYALKKLRKSLETADCED